MYGEKIMAKVVKDFNLTKEGLTLNDGNVYEFIDVSIIKKAGEYGFKGYGFAEMHNISDPVIKVGFTDRDNAAYRLEEQNGLNTCLFLYRAKKDITGNLDNLANKRLKAYYDNTKKSCGYIPLLKDSSNTSSEQGQHGATEKYNLYTSKGFCNILNCLEEDYEVVTCHNIDEYLDTKETQTLENKDKDDIYSDIEEFAKQIIYETSATSTVKGTVVLLKLTMRYGKTSLLMQLFKMLHNEHPNEATLSVLAYYVGTVKKSYDSFAEKYNGFEDIFALDIKEFDNPAKTRQILKKLDEYIQKCTENQKAPQVVVTVALTGGTPNDQEEDKVLDNKTLSRRLKPLKDYKHIFKHVNLAIEEADFGAHCIKALNGIKTICRFFDREYSCMGRVFVASGTGEQKFHKYIEKDMSSVMYSISYSELCAKRTFMPRLNYFILAIQELAKFKLDLQGVLSFNEMLAEGNLEVNESIDNNGNKIVKYSLNKRAQNFFKAVFRIIFNPSDDTYNYLRDVADDDTVNRYVEFICKMINKDKASIVFINATNKALEAIGECLSELFASHKLAVKVINSNKATNDTCEEIVKNFIKDNETIKKKAIILANKMCNRSFSVKEIKNVILMGDSMGADTFMQKALRGTTPDGKVTSTDANIIDLRMNISTDYEDYKYDNLATFMQNELGAKSEGKDSSGKVQITTPYKDLMDTTTRYINIFTLTKEGAFEKLEDNTVTEILERNTSFREFRLNEAIKKIDAIEHNFGSNSKEIKTEGNKQSFEKNTPARPFSFSGRAMFITNSNKPKEERSKETLEQKIKRSYADLVAKFPMFFYNGLIPAEELTWGRVKDNLRVLINSNEKESNEIRDYLDLELLIKVIDVLYKEDILKDSDFKNICNAEISIKNTELNNLNLFSAKNTYTEGYINIVDLMCNKGKVTEDDNVLMLGISNPNVVSRTIDKYHPKNAFIIEDNINSVAGNFVDENGNNLIHYTDLNSVESILNNIKNIEREYGLKFDKIIMNPPYKGKSNLHLAIIDQMLKIFPEADIINISPVSWLQDILADYKRGTAYSKYNHLLDYLADLITVSALDASRCFNISSVGDLGIYHFNKKAFLDNAVRFDTINFKLDTPEKKLASKLAEKFYFNHERLDKDVYSNKNFIFTLPRIHGNIGSSDWGELCSRDKEDAYAFKKSNDSNSKNKYVSVGFATSFERDNFHSSLFTKFYQFYVANVRRGIDTPNLLPFVPHFFNVNWEGKTGTIDGYKNPITDEMLYEYFGLTDEEIKTVEDFYEELKSR